MHRATLASAPRGAAGWHARPLAPLGARGNGSRLHILVTLRDSVAGVSASTRPARYHHVSCGGISVPPARRVAAAAAAADPSPSASTDATSQGPSAWADEINEVLELIQLLPAAVRDSLSAHPDFYDLLEVVMDLGRPPLARFPSGDVRLSDEAVTADDIAYAVSRVGQFGGDNRAGIDRTLHRISCMRNRRGGVVGLTCRVGRAVPNSAKMVEDLVASGASILFLGRPGVGKTTAIRESSRMLADALMKRVVIVDTSNEIGGDGDIPHPGIGRARRMQVAVPEEQHRVMIEAVENHMPEVVVIDEIGTEAECVAARTIAQRGVQLVATAHGNYLENVVKNPALSDLVGGIQSVTLGDEEAKRRGVQKSILERAAPPTFDVAIEMLERGRWKVHLDVAAAVDRILAGAEPGGQVRERTADGEIKMYKYGSSGGGGAGGSTAARSKAGGSKASSLSASSSASAAATAAAYGGYGSAAGSDSEADEFEAEPLADKPSRPGSTSRDGMPTPLELINHKASALSPAEAGLTPGGGLGAADPSSALLRLYAYELDEEAVVQVVAAMRLQGKVYFTQRLAQADAVLAVRSKLKQNSALRAAAKQAGVPVYAIKTSAAGNLVRAFRTLLGIDPSAGGMFVRGGGGSSAGSGAGSIDEDVMLAAAAAAGGASLDDGDVGSSGGFPSSERSGGGSSFRRAAVPVAAGAAAGSSSSSYRGRSVEDALEEARLAAEQIVLPLRQPVELMPRVEAVIAQQIDLVRRYRLNYEIVAASGGGGGSDSARLRILPADMATGGGGSDGLSDDGADAVSVPSAATQPVTAANALSDQ